MISPIMVITQHFHERKAGLRIVPDGDGATDLWRSPGPHCRHLLVAFSPSDLADGHECGRTETIRPPTTALMK